jgi:hypothetical protein
MEKDAKRERGLSVSDDSMDEEQLQAEHDRLNGHNDYNREEGEQKASCRSLILA